MRLGIALAPIQCAFMQILSTFVCFFSLFIAIDFIFSFFPSAFYCLGFHDTYQSSKQMCYVTKLRIQSVIALYWFNESRQMKRKIKKNDSPIWFVISVVILCSSGSTKPEIRKALNAWLSNVIALVRMLRSQNDTTNMLLSRSFFIIKNDFKHSYLCYRLWMWISFETRHSCHSIKCFVELISIFRPKVTLITHSLFRIVASKA